MKEFALKHPIILFLIIDKVVTSLCNAFVYHEMQSTDASHIEEVVENSIVAAKNGIRHYKKEPIGFKPNRESA